MRIKQYQIDAFATRVFEGNPAAVCPLESWLDDDLLQAIAAENNLSKTAFFVPSEKGFRLRWFTPVKEIDLCGHATLAAAHVIFAIPGHAGPAITFETRCGDLTVNCELTPYWAGKLGKNILNARQVSRRGGNIACELQADRVHLAGSAVTFMEAAISF